MTSPDRPGPPRRSLAARLTVWFAASALLLVSLAAVLLYAALDSSLDREDDEFLADQVRILRSILRDRPADGETLRQEVQFESAARRHSQVFMRVLDDSGRTLVETNGMAAVLPPSVFPSPVAAAIEPEEGAGATAADARAFRALAARAAVGDSPGEERVVQVAIDRSRDDALLARFRRAILIALGVALLVAVAVGYVIARRGIRPVTEMAGTARRIGSSTLDRRIALDGLPAELADLARTFNEMLGRLEESFQRLSRFSADLAHELRTPIGNLRGELEVALGRARSPEEYRDALGSALEETDRLSSIIDTLLFLARAENCSATLSRTSLDVGAELRATCEFFEAAANDAGVALAVDAPQPVAASLDRALFQRAVGNLVSNALAHTPRGGSVTLSACVDDDAVRIEVADTGSGIAPAHLPHVFERFYRGDPSRTGGAGGAGLGLAIVRTIAALHGGTAELKSTVGRGTRVTLRLPAGTTAVPG
ncbi:MAG: heavy metal sensor histidine kinase [Deltaproteobacteria bacterium]|nr:heavy metal sensor histidine kinase [Deltaproteobacteria bacterium]